MGLTKSFDIFEQSVRVRAETFVRSTGQTIADGRAGSGQDGSLLLTSRQTILKVFLRSLAFERETEAYRRLSRSGALTIQGHNVPQLLAVDEMLGIIEMTRVVPPFLLDFGKVRFDQPLERAWPDHVMAERCSHWRSLFPASQWPTVLAIFNELGRYGIWLEDIHPGNISFET